MYFMRERRRERKKDEERYPYNDDIAICAVIKLKNGIKSILHI